MKRYIIFIFITLQYCIVYGQFKAVHIPDDIVVKMKIDGDTSDWNWVPEKYLITEQSMNKIASINDNDNWNCWVKVGWSDLNHKLYIIAKVTEDIFITNNSGYNNDCMHFAINPDNGGGSYGGENDRTKHTIRGHFMPISDKNTELLIDVGPTWLVEHEKKHITWNVQHHNKKEGGYERIYEMSLSLWDKWEREGPEYSSPTELYSSKKIRLALSFNDSDALDNTVTEWVIVVGRGWMRNADRILKFTLDMPLKNDISWQGIHYILSQ